LYEPNIFILNRLNTTLLIIITTEPNQISSELDQGKNGQFSLKGGHSTQMQAGCSMPVMWQWGIHLTKYKI